LAALREEKRRILAKIDASSASLDDVSYKNSELEKLIKELEYDSNSLNRQNAGLQSNNDNLTAELRTREDNLDTVERQVSDTQKNIADLDADCQDLERLNERTRAEAIQQQRVVQQEVNKNLDLTAKANSLDNTLRSREIQAAELRRELENLKNSRVNLEDNKAQLQQELEIVKRDTDAISYQNNDLIDELERFNIEDEKAKIILDRRDRVTDLKFKSQQQLKKNSQNRNKYERSPSPSRLGSAQKLVRY